jgi:3-dehydroquinate synthase
MVMAADFSVSRDLLNADEARRLRGVVQAAGLPVTPPALASSAFMQAMAHDKKVLGGRIRLVMLHRLGEAIVTDDYPADELDRFVSNALEEVAS